MAGSPLEQFVIKPLIPLNIAGYDVSFTQSSAWMIAGVVVATLLMTATVKKGGLVPSRWQNVAEILYEFIFSVVRDNLGDKARTYFPLVFSVFMIVLMGNVLGLIPYSFTYTSHIIVTGSLAIFVFLFATLLGFVLHGTHFLSLFLPKDLPLFLVPFIVVIELISYLSRPISLSVRLFANMMAGHTMMKVFAGFSVAFLSLGAGGYALGIVPMVVNTAIYALELLVAVIQAYVFAVLTSAYLKDSIELH